MPTLFLQRMSSRLRRRLWNAPLDALPASLHPRCARDASLVAEIAAYERSAGGAHAAGSLPLRTLARIEQLMQGDALASVETGCGKSTIFFSRICARHTVFCLDDRATGAASSVAYYMNCPATRADRVETIFGPTQATLPRYEAHTPYDLVLIDGPHGFPFPELEYFFLYPHIKTGGLLVIDDINIPTIGRLADFLCEDRMFEKVEFIGGTAVFRRTDAPLFDPFGDGWWLQDFNRRRAHFAKDIYLEDGKKLVPISFEKKF